jgi:hypothetical protein
MRGFFPRTVLRPAQLFQRPRIRNYAAATPSSASKAIRNEARAPETPKQKRKRRQAPPPLATIILNERKGVLDEPDKLKRGARRGLKKVSEDGKVESRADRINFRPRGPTRVKRGEKSITLKRARYLTGLCR